MASSNPLLTPWEKFASKWDKGMGDEGNDYFRYLELPILGKLIKPVEGSRALDLATGNGLVARWLAQKGAASVVATDGAFAMLEHAKAREEGFADAVRILYHRLDVTSQESWDDFIRGDLGLKNGAFDFITMNMAIMDIQDLQPLAKALKQLLKPKGCFVATLLHPIFFTSGASRQILVHEDPETGEHSIERSMVMTRYLNVPPAKQMVFPGRKAETPYMYHRPLHMLFTPFFEVGLTMDALEETNFDESFFDPVRVHSSKNFTEFPKILGFRMRRSGNSGSSLEETTT
ncbi:S-adenosyl-L-methionine-dependent methyltransferase [Aspergillus karnatakaensis]|uniref:class I SAM-dependent methyltransferase n=1 Tax=Aspergillus karnatakaensis TaxID=1810916 RepID=UPI003CCD8551